MENGSVTEARPGPETGEQVQPKETSRKYGLLSRLRSYFFFDLLIWLYTVVFGVASIPFGFFDKDGSILHNFASGWAKMIMKPIFSPLRVIGLEKVDCSKTHVYAV